MWIEQLLSTGKISEEQLSDASALSDQKSIRLDEALIEWKYATWDEIAPLRAADNGVPYYARDAPYTEATTPNRCPLCESAIDQSRIIVVGIWDAEVDGISGPVLECRCTHCWARLMADGHANWDFTGSCWRFDPKWS